MKKINPPNVDDRKIIRNIASNSRLHLTTYPHLQHHLNLIIQSYDEYDQNNGNPWLLDQPNITEELKRGLKKHYSSPPEGLNYLESLRKSSPQVCPMCGGFHPTTLDHYLPKTNYPAWAIYSKNLIPACNCNIVRGEVVKSDMNPLGRILHPYFDDCLNDRIITTDITYCQNFKWLKARVISVNPNHPDVDAIIFHINNIIIKNGIENWLNGQLTKLKESPSSVIPHLPRRKATTIEGLLESIQDCIQSYDDLTETPNNWNSILLDGLLRANGIHEWLITRHNDMVLKRNQ